SPYRAPPAAAPISKVTLPSLSWRPATAAMRPDMVADPILRTPRPEIAALSKLCAAAGVMASAAEASRIERSILLTPLRRLGRTDRRLACRRLLGRRLGCLRLVRCVGRLASGFGRGYRTAGFGEEGRGDGRIGGSGRGKY